MDLYRDLYRNEYQFTRRHQHDIIYVTSREKLLTLFCACIFGDFPVDDDLSYFKDGFVDAFDPKVVSLDEGGLVEIFRTGGTSALRIGHSKLTIDYHDRSDPALYVLDVSKPQDLIDFWNLRGIRQNVLPIPIQWINELAAFAKDFIIHNFRPLPGNNNGVMVHPTVMFARSIPTEDIDGLYDDHFRIDVRGASSRQDWYPQLWKASPAFAARQLRPTVSAESQSIDVPVESGNSELRFAGLHPTFASEYGNDNRWANVVRLRDWDLGDQIATVYPTNYRKAEGLNFAFDIDGLRSTTEGVVAIPRYRGLSHFWRLSEGTTAIRKWLDAQNVKAVTSDAGRATQQIVQTLGGFWGVSSFAHPEIVKLLNEISRKPGSRSIQHQEFRNRIANATKDEIWRRRNFETLVRRHAVELGLEIKCEKCSSWSWQALKDIDQTINCGLCLRQFPFPIVDPSSNQHTRWSYRLIGPFALPDYARGGYAAALTLRFFSETVGPSDHAQITWSAGQELELTLGRKVEADVTLWYQRKQLLENDYPTEAVFGEVKSFGKEAFEQEDVDRMRLLAERFPGSIIVFSTMKEASELSKSEIARLRRFASWGREYIPRQQRTRAPVIILTGTELFAARSLRAAWEEKGGRHADIAARGWVRMEDLRLLADFTQQLYLDMASYGAFLEEKWRRRQRNQVV